MPLDLGRRQLIYSHVMAIRCGDNSAHLYHFYGVGLIYLQGHASIQGAAVLHAVDG